MFTIDDKLLTVTIQSTLPISIDAVTTRTFLDQLREYKSILASLTAVNLVWSVAQDAYRYTWDTSDGRQWREFIKVPPGAPTSHRIDLQYWFTMPEFTPHRRLRDATLAVMREFGVTSISATFK